MSKIIDLNLFKIIKTKADRHFKNTKSADSPNDDLKYRFIQISQILLEAWKDEAINNNLNKFIISHFNSSKLKIERNLDYTADLNAISKLEQSLKLSPLILGPGTTPSTPIGWSSGFFMSGLLITTPEFSSEAYARCFGLLLFILLTDKRNNFLNVDLI